MAEPGETGASALSGSKRSLRGPLVALALLAIGLAFCHGGMVASGGDLPGDLGDLRYNTAILEHDWRWLRGVPGHEHLFSPPWFWPHQGTLAYSENLLGTLPVYALARAAGLGPFGAVQAWVVFFSLASFAAFFALARAAGASTEGAALGAFLFAFALPRGAQLCQHIQLLPHGADLRYPQEQAMFAGFLPWIALGAAIALLRDRRAGDQRLQRVGPAALGAAPRCPARRAARGHRVARERGTRPGEDARRDRTARGGRRRPVRRRAAGRPRPAPAYPRDRARLARSITKR